MLARANEHRKEASATATTAAHVPVSPPSCMQPHIHNHPSWVLMHMSSDSRSHGAACMPHMANLQAFNDTCILAELQSRWLSGYMCKLACCPVYN